MCVPHARPPSQSGRSPSISEAGALRWQEWASQGNGAPESCIILDDGKVRNSNAEGSGVMYGRPGWVWKETCGREERVLAPCNHAAALHKKVQQEERPHAEEGKGKKYPIERIEQVLL